MFLILILVLAVIFVISWFAATQFYEIAEIKGYSESKYFWWCFWLGIVGYLMVIALPDRRNMSFNRSDNADKLPGRQEGLGEMSERYSSLFSLPENLYSEGAPVIIAEGSLLKDNQTGRVLAQLKIQNISDKVIKAATVSIVSLDTIGKPLGEVVSYQYLDLNAGRDAEFGQKSPVALPDAATRAFSASVSEVIFTDDTAWSTSEIPWTPIFVNLSLEQALQDRELIKQFKIRYNEDSKYIFKKEQDLWLCVCGKINHQNEERCHKCRRWASVLAAWDLNELKASMNQRLEIEQKTAH